MLLFGFLDGFFFGFFLLFCLMAFAVYRIGRSTIGSPVKAISWAKALFGMLYGSAGQNEGSGR